MKGQWLQAVETVDKKQGRIWRHKPHNRLGIPVRSGTNFKSEVNETGGNLYGYFQNYKKDKDVIS